MSSVLPTVPHQLHADHNGKPHHHDAVVAAARKVQESLFPRPMPDLAGWEFASYSSPAQEVTGDYLDVFELSPGQVALALGDVSGKGLGAGLVMACLHGFLHGRLPAAPSDLPRLMREMNTYLLQATPPDVFVSLFLGVLDVATGALSYVNAGHPPPLLLADSAAPVELNEAGSLLGIFDNPARESVRVTLPPGSLLVLFSDGVTEARNRHDQPFHARRLAEVLRGAPRSARAAVRSVVEAVRSFVGPARQSDDQSVLAVHRRPLPQRLAHHPAFPSLESRRDSA
jgi:sigma-B regulation protein RsbU (phosphoserine phosphatase)